MKKLLLIMIVGLLSTQVSAYQYGLQSGYSPIKVVLVSETQGHYGKKFCNYQKFKFDYLIAQFTKVVPSNMACPVINN